MINSPVPGEHLGNQAILPKYSKYLILLRPDFQHILEPCHPQHNRLKNRNRTSAVLHLASVNASSESAALHPLSARDPILLYDNVHKLISIFPYPKVINHATYYFYTRGTYRQMQRNPLVP